MRGRAWSGRSARPGLRCCASRPGWAPVWGSPRTRSSRWPNDMGRQPRSRPVAMAQTPMTTSARRRCCGRAARSSRMPTSCPSTGPTDMRGRWRGGHRPVAARSPIPPAARPSCCVRSALATPGNWMSIGCGPSGAVAATIGGVRFRWAPNRTASCRTSSCAPRTLAASGFTQWSSEPAARASRSSSCRWSMGSR
ncbi:membrane protein [Mycobacterium tuberculosis]|uniref:Membrane protein n=1 Tax=Mycobacterium tuberculosis TaxID=1773 RepID=A0A655FG75_MYCTX|nr:membrane protein [Mycobacterium tuberculosis]CKT47316.1 membrane protein [Mycobacterium tuberculosis]CNV71761.1 membrane protein [Mycobacterium tuberculosis]